MVFRGRGDDRQGGPGDLVRATRRQSAGPHILALIAVLLLVAACGGETASTPPTTSGSTDTSTAQTSPAASGEVKRIAVFQLADLDLLTQITDAFKAGLAENGYGAGRVEFETYSAQGQSNLVPTVARQVVDSDPDLIFVVGTPAVLAVAQETNSIPVVFGAMGDPVGAGVAENLEQPGGNATGTTDWIPPSATLDVVLQVMPDAKRIGTIYDPSNQNGEVFRNALSDAAEAKGLDFVDVSISNSGEVQNAVRSMAGRVDAIIVGPDAQVIEGNPAIASVALEEGIAYFSTVGRPEVPGQLMTLGVDYATLGRMAGEDAAHILDGQDPGQLPIRGMDQFSMEVNQETLSALGITLPDAIASSATVYEAP